MHRRAAILIQSGSATDRQADLCAPYCLEQRFAIKTIVPYWAAEQAAQLVRDGLVDVVVVAYEGRQLADVVSKVVEAGGKVVAVHPEPRELQPPRQVTRWLTDLVARWHRRGRSAHEIADLLDEDTTDIQSVLMQIGLDPTRR